MPEMVLPGCRPEPLASYLKALAILRLVGTQVDPGARAHWRGDSFVLTSELDEEGLVRFLCDTYRPSPIVSPWNGGSGFWPKDRRAGMEAIAASTAPRFAAYRSAIEIGRRVLHDLGLGGDAGDTEEDDEDPSWKAQLIATLRAELPEEALGWLDAALVLAPDGVGYPPLLGSGGNDGRLDFSNNQMERLAALLLPAGPESEAQARAALYGTPIAGLKSLTVGQFVPVVAGGANNGPGFSGSVVVNPWDFVMMLEGTLMVSASLTRRLESSAPGALSYPFTVRTSGVGYGSAAAKDEEGSRNEVWMPLWSAPASPAALRALFSEGRATVKARRARTAVTGTDFTRAVATLGVDRGIDRFARYGFLKRNGKAFFATPLGVARVSRQERADLLAPLDRWLENLRRAASGDRAPSSLRRARADVERAVVDVCAGRCTSLLPLLLALASAERAVARSGVTDSLQPVPFLPGADWLPQVEEATAEFRLARSLAGQGYRRRIVPIEGRRPDWAGTDLGVTFLGGPLELQLCATLAREAVEADARATPAGPAAPLADVAAWLDRAVDDRRILALVHALGLLDRQTLGNSSDAPRRGSPSAAFALTSLVWRRAIPNLDPLPATPEILPLLRAGRIREATRLAARRLRSSGRPPTIGDAPAPQGTGPRLAAALAFPIAFGDRVELLASLGIERESNPHTESGEPS